MPAWAICLLGGKINRVYIKTLGYKPALYISGWIGTPVHELSHAAMAVIFGFKVKKIELFTPENDGTLGLVLYVPRGPRVIQEVGRFMVALAPLPGGTLVLYILLLILVPESRLAANSIQSVLSYSEVSVLDTIFSFLLAAIQGVFSLFGRIDFFSFRHLLFFYFSMAIAAHIAPSKEDFSQSRKGFVYLGLFILFLALMNTLISGNHVENSLFFLRKLLAVPASLLILSLSMGLIVFFTSLSLAFTVRHFRKKI